MNTKLELLLIEESNKQLLNLNRSYYLYRITNEGKIQLNKIDLSNNLKAQEGKLCIKLEPTIQDQELCNLYLNLVRTFYIDKDMYIVSIGIGLKKEIEKQAMR
ncbi:MAG: hypothetical protein PHY26_02425 [Bacilli bacterium]|jgi:hypothetical protein|nr:hypothetical protein [Bacilli bacterium]